MSWLDGRIAAARPAWLRLTRRHPPPSGVAAAPADRADCTAAVRTSCLAPYLANQLGSASFQDMAARCVCAAWSLRRCQAAACGRLPLPLIPRGGRGCLACQLCAVPRADTWLPGVSSREARRRRGALCKDRCSAAQALLWLRPAAPPPPPRPILATLSPRRHTFYRSLLQCAEALCCAPTAELLSWRSEGSSRSIASAISQLETQVGARAPEGRRCGLASGGMAPCIRVRIPASPNPPLGFPNSPSPHPLHPSPCRPSPQASHFVRVYNQAAAPPGGAGGAGGSGAAAGQCVESAEDQAEHDLALFLLKVAPEVAEAAPAAARAAAPAAGGRRGGARGGAAGGGDEGARGGVVGWRKDKARGQAEARRSTCSLLPQRSACLLAASCCTPELYTHASPPRLLPSSPHPPRSLSAGQSAEEAYRLTLSQYRVRICDGVAANHK